MSATLFEANAFNPIAAEWIRRGPAPMRASAARTASRDPVGYRGGPLPGLPGPAPAPFRWPEQLLRWLAEMPREMPPRG